MVSRRFRHALSLTILSVATLMSHRIASSQPAGSAATPAFDLQGHRGARGLLPENTIPAFLRALELGVTTLEMDAVVTADSQVVVSHEPWFSSVICSDPSGVPIAASEEDAHRIYALTYEEVAAYDCGLRGHPLFPGQQPMRAAKPLLREVIAAAEAFVAAHGLPPVRYNVETKARPEWDGAYTPDPETFTRLVYDVLAGGGVKERATLQSFDVRTLQAARRLDAALQLSLLVEFRPEHLLEDDLAVLGFTPEVYSPDFRLVDASLVAAAHDRGMRVIPWTVNTPEAMRAIVASGADGLITDYPDVARDVLR